MPQRPRSFFYFAVRHVRVLLDEQDRDALAVDLTDDLKDPAHDDRRKAERRFVHHDELRLGHQRPADGQHLLLAARERPGLLPFALLEAREQIVHAGKIVRERVLAQVCADAQILRHGQVRKDPAALRHERDAARDDLVGRFSDQIRTVQQNFAGLRPDQTGDGLQRRGLACAVRADEGDDLAFFDGQVDALDGLDAAVGDDQILDLQNVTHLRPPPDTRR